jgi:hypothetical protein
MSTGGVFDYPERRTISQQREWNQWLAYLDRCDDDDDEPTPKPLADAPAPTPENARTMHRYSEAQQDAYGDRMRARYGDER